jgi:hypothetical protein
MQLLSASFEAAKAKLAVDSLASKDLPEIKELLKSIIDQNLVLREMYAELMKETLPAPWKEKKE